MSLTFQTLQANWQAQWDKALLCWSRYVRLHDPRWCVSIEDERKEGLEGSFAMIRLVDHSVVISVRQIVERGLNAYATEILAHEIGHHVYCPADLTDHGRLLARVRAGLPTKEHLAGFIANLYADLLINDRLQRSNGLDMTGVYLMLGNNSQDRMWTLYMRIYELLWKLARGTLAKGEVAETLEGDAQLGARLIRVYSKDWLDGAGRFAALCLPYLLEDEGKEIRRLLAGWQDTAKAGDGGDPAGLAEEDPAEQAGAVHPALDESLDGTRSGNLDRPEETTAAPDKARRNIDGGQKNHDGYRGPLEYGELLKALGTALSDKEIAAKYYRERALPHLIPYPIVRRQRHTESVPETLNAWDLGSPLESIDWLQSLIRSPIVVPGVTTVQRKYGEVPGNEPALTPIDLYVGIDCSGSMPNPQRQLSYPTLAGTIVALSALRAGARVKVVLSGEPGQSISTPDFVRDERQVLRVLTGYLGTGFAFGVHRLEESFSPSQKTRPTHVLIISDQDIFRMLDNSVHNKTGWDVASTALRSAGGGGTLVLHMPNQWNDRRIERLADEGWNLHRLYNWEELVTFARKFSKTRYEAANHVRE